MRYQVIVRRVTSGDDDLPAQLLNTIPLYEQIFDANVDFADDIGELAGGCIEEAIRCDVAAQGDSKS